MARELLVFGKKTFKITIPDDAKTTFAPFSPPSTDRNGYGRGGYNHKNSGTLRIYEGKTEKSNILAVFAGVFGFRDLSLGYAEEVVREEGATIWKDDEHGYVRENKVSGQKGWVEPELKALPPVTTEGEEIF